MLDEALDETFPASDPLPMAPGTDAAPHHILYYMPGTCALGIHIALEWAGGRYDTRRVSRKSLKEPEYLALNPSGVVPTLLWDGDVLTEAPAILLALARRFPVLGPGPEGSEEERRRFERLVIYLGGTLHPYFWPWFVPGRYGADEQADVARLQRAAEALIGTAFTRLEAEIGDRPFFMGDAPSAVDAFFFPMGRWGLGLAKPTTDYPNLNRLLRRLADNPGVGAAMRAQGLPPLFDA